MGQSSKATALVGNGNIKRFVMLSSHTCYHNDQEENEQPLRHRCHWTSARL